MTAAFHDDFTVYRIDESGKANLILGVPSGPRVLLNPPKDRIPAHDVAEFPLHGPVAALTRGDGTLFVIERLHLTVRRYRSGGDLESLFERSRVSRDGSTQQAPRQGRVEEFHPPNPCALALDSLDRLHLCDPTLQAILRVDPQAGTFERVLESPRRSAGRTRLGPSACAFGPDGTAWIADSGRQEIRGYGVDANGQWTALPSVLSEVEGDSIILVPGGLGLVAHA
jgi:hypothetical protein